jgi:transcriptional regulator with GAF, ATPase, and Fis domain
MTARSGKTPVRSQTRGKSSALTKVHRNEYISWALIVAVALLTLLSSASVLPPILSDRLASFWIFSKAQMMVIVGLSLTLLLLAGLAHQQRYLKALRRQFESHQHMERDRAQRHTSRLYALLNVGRMMVSQSDLQTVFESIVKMCIEVFSCDQASLMLHDVESGTLVVRAVAGKLVPEGILGTRQPVGSGVAGWVAQKREPLFLRPGVDSAPPGLELKKKDLCSAMVVPIMLRDELVGVINVSTRSPDVHLDDDDLRALQAFAENIGAAIRHTEQAEWMRATIRKLQGQKDKTGISGSYQARPTS